MKSISFIFVVGLTLGSLNLSANQTVAVDAKCADEVFDHLGKQDGPIYKRITLLDDAAEKAESAGNRDLEIQLREKRGAILDLMFKLTEASCQ
jgi:hypothetical protein